MLSGYEIDKQIQAGKIRIDPYIPAHMGPNSLDLRLSNQLLVYEETDKWVLNAADRNPTRTIIMPAYPDGYVLRPGILYLGATMEHTETDHYVPCIEGRSSIGRLGVNIHATAGFGDIGFKGTWTLEISCIHPVRIYPGMRICQLYFSPVEDTSGKPLRQYHTKYQRQTGPQPSKSWEDFQNRE